MKITVSQLRRIIKEEISLTRGSRALREGETMYDIIVKAKKIQGIYNMSQRLADELRNAENAAQRMGSTYPYEDLLDMAEDFVQTLTDELDRFPYGLESHLVNFENATERFADLLQSDRGSHRLVTAIGSGTSAHYFKDMSRYLRSLQRVIENEIK